MNSFYLEFHYEEIENPELPLISLTSKKTYSLRHRKTEEPPNIKKKVLTKSLNLRTKLPTKVRTKRVQEAQINVQTKKDKTKRTCEHCGIIVSSGNISKHLRGVHLKEKHFFCDLCE